MHTSAASSLRVVVVQKPGGLRPHSASRLRSRRICRATNDNFTESCQKPSVAQEGDRHKMKSQRGTAMCLTNIRDMMFCIRPLGVRISPMRAAIIFAGRIQLRDIRGHLTNAS